MQKNNALIRLPQGFTLLELIVAIALMDVIAVALYSSMYIGFRTYKNSKALLKPYQSVMPAFEFMRHDVTSAVRPDGILAGVFVGENVPGQGDRDADTLSFFTCSYRPEAGEAASNIVRIGYALDADAQRNQVVLKRLITKNILSPTAADPQEEIVCRGAAGLDIKYFDGSGWAEEWDSSAQNGQLPRGVQITLTLEDPENSRSSDDGTRTFTRIFLLAAATPETDAQGQENGQQDE